MGLTIVVQSDEVEEAVERVFDLLADWQDEGRTPSAMTVALNSVLEIVIEEAAETTRH